MSHKVNGYCPQGCGMTLHLDSEGTLVCLNIHCPEPYTANNILMETETEHIVECLEDSWSMKHPLRERVDDALLTCAAADEASFTAQHMLLGIYRLSFDGVWTWERL